MKKKRSAVSVQRELLTKERDMTRLWVSADSRETPLSTDSQFQYTVRFGLIEGQGIDEVVRDTPGLPQRGDQNGGGFG